MGLPVRILGIAPYEELKTLMQKLAEEVYPQVELTLFVRDMEQGLEAAQSNFHGNYDVIISRGGTARMLRQHLALPVVEVEVSPYDILRTLKLADGLTGKTAMVSFENITHNARQLCELLNYPLDILTIDGPEDVAPTLSRLQEADYKTILCDVISHVTAKRMGLNSFLITSGADSICRAFDQALLLCGSQTRLREENLFFRELLQGQGQLGQTAVFDEAGRLFFSSQEAPSPKVLELLRRELPESRGVKKRRISRSLGGSLYSIHSQHIAAGDTAYVAFFFTSHRPPLPSHRMGIRFLSQGDAERALGDSLFSFADLIPNYQEEISRINQSGAPVMISGEGGTGRESMASVLYVKGPLRTRPFVTVNGSLLTEKSYAYLLEHRNSPLYDKGQTLYFSSIDAMPPDRRQQLLAVLAEMEVCRRNRVILSCICREGECASEVGAVFMNELNCLSLYLPPLRTMPERIPLLVNLALNHLSADMPRQIVGIEPKALHTLQAFPWLHNYTQFRRVIGELAVMATGPFITAWDVEQALQRERHIGVLSPQRDSATAPLDLTRPLHEINQEIIHRVLDESGGSQTEASRRLGVSRTTLWRLMKRR